MSQFRPDSLQSLVGCENIKEAIKVALRSSVVRNDAFPHTLIYGGAGLGKTTIGNAIAKERGGDFQIYLANIFKTRLDVQNLMNKLNFENHYDTTPDDPDGFGVPTAKFKVTDRIKPTVIFLDEIHKLSRDVQECFFQAMEDNAFTQEVRNPQNGKIEKFIGWVPKFTLIGATTRAGDLDRPFVDRFKLQLTLHLYSDKEIETILTNYAKRLALKISNEAIVEIARRSRGIPRKSISFIERARDMSIYMGIDGITKDVTDKTFETHEVNETGLEPNDTQILKYLYKIFPRKAGVARLAGELNVTENVMKEVIEPYLLRQGLMDVTPSGRIITPAGMIYCERNNLLPQDVTPEGATRRIKANV